MQVFVFFVDYDFIYICCFNRYLFVYICWTAVARSALEGYWLSFEHSQVCFCTRLYLLSRAFLGAFRTSATFLNRTILYLMQHSLTAGIYSSTISKDFCLLDIFKFSTIFSFKWNMIVHINWLCGMRIALTINISSLKCEVIHINLFKRLPKFR